MRSRSVLRNDFFSIEEKSFKYKNNLISEQAFNEHLILYRNYISKSSKTVGSLKRYESDDEFYGLKDMETYNNNGVLLHELFFSNLKEYNDEIPQNILNMFHKDFGGLQQWKNDFTNCAKISRGWTITTYDVLTHAFKNIMLQSHNVGLTCGSIPLIVIDCYEHAYWFDYQTRKIDYINKFVNENIAWDIISDRLDKII